MQRLLAAVLFAGMAIAQGTQPAPGPIGDNRILGIVPDFNTVNQPLKTYTPMSAREKFRLAALDSFDPYSWAITGVYAAAAQWGNNYPEFGQGAQGYAKRYGAAFADGAIGTYFTEAILPAALHEDPRYFRLGSGSAWKRAGYALTRVLVTRNDSGGERFNNSEIAGNLIAAAIAVSYYPPGNRTAGEAMEHFTVSLVSDAGFNVLKEFWPDMRRKVLHKGDPETPGN